MSGVQLAAVSESSWRLSGVLDFDSAPALLAQSVTMMSGSTPLEIDLTALSCRDSAALAVLIAWRRQAGVLARPVVFVNIPAPLLVVARVCGVEDILTESGMTSERGLWTN